MVATELAGKTLERYNREGQEPEVSPPHEAESAVGPEQVTADAATELAAESTDQDDVTELAAESTDQDAITELAGKSAEQAEKLMDVCSVSESSVAEELMDRCSVT